MPRTDIDDNRSLSRLQGIDLREHGDSNTALDCVNVHLNNASRLTNFPPPTKVKSGNYAFACESKDPAAQEFDLALDSHFGTPGITRQEPYNSGLQVKLTGANLVGNVQIILIDESGHCLESGLDFDVSASGDTLILDMLWSDFAEFEKIVIKNAYGWATIDVDVSEAYNNVLYIAEYFKMGINNQTLEFCIWFKRNGSWVEAQSWKNEAATPWIESPENKIKVEGLDITDGTSHFCFFPQGGSVSNVSLRLGYTNYPVASWAEVVTNAQNNTIQTWGPTSGRFINNAVPYTATQYKYEFGMYKSYRLQLVLNEEDQTIGLELQSKTDYTSDTYDVILQRWIYE